MLYNKRFNEFITESIKGIILIGTYNIDDALEISKLLQNNRL